MRRGRHWCRPAGRAYGPLASEVAIAFGGAATRLLAREATDGDTPATPCARTVTRQVAARQDRHHDAEPLTPRSISSMRFVPATKSQTLEHRAVAAARPSRRVALAADRLRRARFVGPAPARTGLWCTCTIDPQQSRSGTIILRYNSTPDRVSSARAAAYPGNKHPRSTCLDNRLT